MSLSCSSFRKRKRDDFDPLGSLSQRQIQVNKKGADIIYNDKVTRLCAKASNI
jgi:hypothetical protein